MKNNSETRRFTFHGNTNLIPICGISCDSPCWGNLQKDQEDHTTSVTDSALGLIVFGYPTYIFNLCYASGAPGKNSKSGRRACVLYDERLKQKILDNEITKKTSNIKP